MSFFTSLADINSFLSEEKLTLRHRIKLSVAKKGKPRPSSVKKKISTTMKGKSNFEGQKHTSLGKENISIGRGDYDPIKGKKWYVNKRTGKTWRKDRNPTETLYKHGRIADSLMYTFKQFILEGRDADLYHGTSLKHAFKILKAGKIGASYNGRTSLTRDQRFAKQYGDRHDTKWDDYNPGVHFKINQRSLSHRQQIKPTDWHMGGSIKDEKHAKDRDPAERRSESEESVKGDIHLKHAHTLVMHKDDYESMAGPKTEHEAAHEAAAKRGESEFRPGSPTSYRNRMRKTKEFHSLLDKHGIKLELSGK